VADSTPAFVRTPRFLRPPVGSATGPAPERENLGSRDRRCSAAATLENPMIHVLAVITAKPGQRERILEAYRDNVATVRAEAGCLAYEAVVDVANPRPASPRSAPTASSSSRSGRRSRRCRRTPWRRT
jgi:hypothetical protein